MSVFHGVPGVPCAKMERFAGQILCFSDLELKTKYQSA
jgi:hypothetical protein